MKLASMRISITPSTLTRDNHLMRLLQSFMKEHGLKQVDIQGILGLSSSGVSSEIVSGKRELTKGALRQAWQSLQSNASGILPKVLA